MQNEVFLYLCIVDSRRGVCLSGGGLTDILDRRLYSVLFWRIETSQLSYWCQEPNNDRCPMGCKYPSCAFFGWRTFGTYNVVIIITYIRRGLRVIVPISRALRRPQFVERQPTIEARAEIKFTLVMPCKEEDDEVNSRVPRFFVLFLIWRKE